MKKYRFEFLVFGISFIAILSWFIWSINYNPVNKDPNTYYFDGKITKIIRSSNHEFSIYRLKLDTAYIHIIDSSFYLQNEAHFPMFRFEGNLGEVYMTYSYSDSVGFQIRKNALKDYMEIINKKGVIVDNIPSFPAITEPLDIEFIKKNSRIKQYLGLPNQKKKQKYRTEPKVSE